MNEMKDRNGKPSDTSRLLQRRQSAWLLFGKPLIPTNLRWRSEAVSCILAPGKKNRLPFPSAQTY